MSRWDDGDRLPEGMERTGYDSDTGRYYFRDRGGSTWEGAEYGEMTRISEGSAQEDVESGPTRADGYRPLATDSNRPIAFRHHVNANAYRTLAPFFLLIGVVLLIVWKFVFSYEWPVPQDPCPANATTPYMIEPGDYCWVIARAHNCTLEELQILNPDMDCNILRPGTVICLPQPVPSNRSIRRSD